MFQQLVTEELVRARSGNAPMNSIHEAYSVILEEVDELWDEVKKKAKLRNRDNMRSELIQIAAMAQRAAEDLGLVEPEAADDVGDPPGFEIVTYTQDISQGFPIRTIKKLRTLEDTQHAVGYVGNGWAGDAVQGRFRVIAVQGNREGKFLTTWDRVETNEVSPETTVQDIGRAIHSQLRKGTLSKF